MNIQQVALQLYTLRDHLKTPADIAATLRKVRAIGYHAIQISGCGPIPEADMVQLCRDNHLTICATHENGQTILDHPEAVVERLQKLGTTLTAYPYPAGIRFDSLDHVKNFCQRLNHAGKILHQAGLTLCYHNHHIEFQRLAGKPVLQIIYEETDPRYLRAEPDTYWIQYGGGDPVAWCQRLHGRLPVIHLKDYTVLPDNKVTFCEVGNGNLDWHRIIPAAEAAGCRWFVVEQDTCAGDPFDSIQQSLHYLRDHVCSP